MAAAPVIIAGASIAGAGASIYSGVQQRKQAKKAERLEQFGIDLQSQFAERAYQADLLAAELAGKRGELDAAAMRVQVALGQRQAAIAVRETLDQADNATVENRKFLAEQSVAFTKAGVDLAGTPLMVLTQTKLDGEKDVLTLTRRAEEIAKTGSVEAAAGYASADARRLAGAIDKNTALTAAGLRRDQAIFSANYDSQGAKLRGKQGQLAGLTTVLQGFSSMASAYGTYKAG